MNSELKILHVLDHSLPLHSGYAFRSLNILRAQQSFGWQPFAVTSAKQQVHQRDSVETEESIAGLTHYRTFLRTEPNLPLVSELTLMRALLKRLARIVKTERPHIIHAHSPILNALPALWIGKKLNTPVVYEVRALWEDAAVDHGTYDQFTWKYRVAKSLETFVCNKADEVVVLSGGLKCDLIERGVAAQRLTVVGNGVDPNQFDQNTPDTGLRKRWNLQGKQVLGFIGSFYRYEGLDLLVEAMARLSTQWPALRLLLVGGGEVEEELRKQIHAMGLASRVIIPGRMPHNEIPTVYALTDILVYPRRSMRLTEVVTPLKPLEAMAMGKTVVASDVGGHRELIRHGHSGVLFRAGSASSLAEALEALLQNEGLRRNLQRQAAEWVQQERTWKKTTAPYATIYSRVLGRRGRDKLDRMEIG